MNKNELRSAANQALFAAQYIAEKHGDKRYLETIKPYFVNTDSGLQPLVADIAEKLQYGTDNFAIQVFAYCARQYVENSKLINAWLNGK